MTLEELEREIQHLATKESVAQLEVKMVKWMIGVQIPTWTGIVGILLVLLTRRGN